MLFATRRRRLAVEALAAIAIIGATVGTTGALFSDSETVPANTWSNGTLDLTTGPASSFVRVTNMAPGDKVAAPLTVSNSGTLPMSYAASSTATGGLAPYLNMTIKAGGTCTVAGFAGDGAPVRPNGVVGTATTAALFGNPAQGRHAGDRALAAGASEQLCFLFDLPLSRGNEVGGQSTSATFRVDAEQLLGPVVENLSTNPSGEANSTHEMRGVYATVTQDSSWASAGSKSIRSTPTGPDSFVTIGNSEHTQGKMAFGMKAGRTYTVSADVRLAAPQTKPVNGNGIRQVTFWWADASGLHKKVTAPCPNVAGVCRSSVTVDLPASTTEVFIRLYNGADTAGGDVWFDRIMVNEGPEAPYSDGDVPGWAWNGVPHQSTSRGPGL